MLFEQLCITKKEDVTCDLKPNQMKKNSQNIAKIIALIDTTMNPFSENIPKEQLYNIGSGRAASQETTNFLLTCKQIGSNAREKFITDNKRFEKKLSKQKVSTLANEGIKYVTRSDKGKLVEVKMERDLFGSILYLAL